MISYVYGDDIHLTVAHKGSGHTASNRIAKRYPYRVIWSHRMTTNEKVHVANPALAHTRWTPR